MSELIAGRSEKDDIRVAQRVEDDEAGNERDGVELMSNGGMRFCL